MAGNLPVRTLRLPPANLAALGLPRSRQIARAWFRVHPRTRDAAFFSLKPTHRYSHPDCPYPLLYVAIDVETCLWEIFGDAVFDHGRALPRTQWDDLMISLVHVPQLDLCDLSRTSTRSTLAVDLTALMNDDLTIPQRWGLAIQTHPSQVPAIKFKSRFTDHACLALFDRGGMRNRLRATPVAPLELCGPALNWLTRHDVALV